MKNNFCSMGSEDTRDTVCELAESDDISAREMFPAEPSELAQRLKRLREATFSVIGKRERLPQPLFWSLFHSEISRLRASKEKKRFEQRLFFECDI